MPDDQRGSRLTKLQGLREHGVEPYGRRFPKDQTLAECRVLGEAVPEGDEPGPAVRTAGRIVAQRDFGKAAFLNLQDQSGAIQVYIRKNVVGPEAFALYQLLDVGDFLGVEGTLGRTRTGELTIFVTALTPLSKALRPLPEKWHGLRDVETRFRQRYLERSGTGCGTWRPASASAISTSSRTRRPARPSRPARGSSRRSAATSRSGASWRSRPR